MDQPPKEALPPSYDDVMNTSADTPQVGFKYPPTNVGVTQGSNPQQQQQQYYVPPTTSPLYPSAPPHPHNAQVPSYGAFETTPTAINVVLQPANIHPTPDIIVIRGCPACRIGILEDSYPCLGLLCALVFFPVGILCCLAMKNKRCSNCATEF